MGSLSKGGLCPMGSGGSKGGRKGCPPGGPNSFNFMQFLGNFGKLVCWHPPPGSWRPLLGEILDPPLIMGSLSGDRHPRASLPREVSV